MGHKSKFTFPVPGRRSKQSSAPANISAPLTKAQRILGTGEINIDAPMLPRGDPRPWDASSMSGISISVSDSSVTNTNDHHMGFLGEEDDELRAIRHGPGQMTWDQESDIIPVHLRSGLGEAARTLRMQRSAMTLGREYMTDGSSLRRRQSSSSTILTYYEKNKVPLSISQQTSSSAMAKGLPTKASNVLDVDGKLGDATGSKKKKPSRLDLSLLRSRSRKRGLAPVGPVLGNDYVMASPTSMSPVSAQDTSAPPLPQRGLSHKTSMRSWRQAAGGVISPLTNNPSRMRGTNDVSGLQQLHDHYEQVSMRQVPWIPRPPQFEPLTLGSALEPSPALASPVTLAAPLASHPVILQSGECWHAHARKDSTGSRNTMGSGGSRMALPSHLTPSQDYASSLSSRHTRTSKTSKTSRTLDSDLQQNSVLSLSDSESDEDDFSETGPKSSVSSHGNLSHDDVFAPSIVETRKSPLSGPPVVPTAESDKAKHTDFTPLNDYLTIPGSSSSSSGRGPSTRMPSNGTLRSNSSSTSTTTAIPHVSSVVAPGRSSHFSVMSNSTIDSISPPPKGYGVHEAKAISIVPLTSTAEAAMAGVLPQTPKSTERARMAPIPERHRKSDQPTPPLSPANMEAYLRSAASMPEEGDKVEDGHNARYMAVTKQEEMLLAALRAKKAKMRESTHTDVEAARSSRGTSNASGRSSNASHSRDGSGVVPEIVDKPKVMDSSSAHLGPRPPMFPSRSSSLLPGLKDLTKINGGTQGRKTHKTSPRAPGVSAPIDRSELTRKRFELALQRVREQGTFKERQEERQRLHQIELQKEQQHHRYPYHSQQHHRYPYHSQQKQPQHPYQNHLEESIPLYLDRSKNKGHAAISPSATSDFINFSGDSDDDEPSQPLSRRSNLDMPDYAYSKRSSASSRQESNIFNSRSPFEIQLQRLPQDANYDIDADDHEHDFDGFSDVMEHDSLGSLRGPGTARPDSPVSLAPGNRNRLYVPGQGHIRGKKSAVRLSAVGRAPSPGPLENPWWGDDD
ncbi:uncharacterized protein BCR38DRAFT_411397 [Pseudomassariella vexata]|uniref:Uncharacterized protein n=1 Tax=Pseudomassariella vexata TaxID=1141098 RepID=A0A1Y2DQG0_9PEZI|nr:uncharacterized protein BCR38DRAFT_411397 [Pseudomassariella vexata]ORY61531.1 hypothetical protein BCR38DRAFT_411397 [Pseudomassariella vexata]